jgi:NTE family protein
MATSLPAPRQKRIGIALGSGSARGIAHVGILQALRDLDIEPDIVCGSSIGALVGAAYLSGAIDEFAEWACNLGTRDVLRFMGIRLLAQGGMAEAGALISHLRDAFGDPDIETLHKPFAAVATELQRGREVWLQQGSLWDAVRASMAIPGLLTPVHHNGEWLVDGGLVNPVPVSVCRALGADVIIAVNLNSVRRTAPTTPLPASDPVTEALERAEEEAIAAEEPVEEPEASLFGRISNSLRSVRPGRAEPADTEPRPGTLNVILTSITVMQDRITRSRLAGEPPDLVLTPRVGHIGLLEFNRGREAQEEGRACVERMQDAIRHALEL